MKITLKHSLMLLIPLCIYIFEIILVCINGPTLVNSICAWGSCIWLLLLIAIDSIKRVYDSEKELKDLEKQIKEIDEKIAKYKINSDFVDYNIDLTNKNNKENNNVEK